MRETICLGSRIYYVPECDRSLAQYLPVTHVHSSLKPQLVTLGRQLVIAPKPKGNGMLARDNAGSYWISKEAFEASRHAVARPAGALRW